MAYPPFIPPFLPAPAPQAEVNFEMRGQRESGDDYEFYLKIGVTAAYKHGATHSLYFTLCKTPRDIHAALQVRIKSGRRVANPRPLYQHFQFAELMGMSLVHKALDAPPKILHISRTNRIIKLLIRG